MRSAIGICVSSFVVATSIFLIGAASSAQAPSSDASISNPTLPLWAYPVVPRVARTSGAATGVTTPTDDGSLKHVPNSTAGYTKKRIADLFSIPDWFPDSHPPMPPVVAEGRKPDVAACAYCHLPNGLGRPENESVAGLSKAYIVEQLADFKSGLRHSSEPRMGSVSYMIRIAKAATPEEIDAAATYFSSMKLKPWIRVVEADTVPKTRIAGGMLVLAEPNGTEPIGERVIEVPENLEQTELRNSTSGFVAYVPTGSLKQGEMLVKTGGNGKTMSCTMCHGPNLKGLGSAPSIAGRSPSQMARQIIDFQNGARNGAGAQMMKAPVAKLTNSDIVAITGYLASLEP
jgi:cytochrome c553